MGFLDSQIFKNNQEPDNQNDDTDLAYSIADRLRSDPTQPVDVKALSEAIARQQKEQNDENDDIFSEYLTGVEGGRRLATLKSILRRK